MRETLNHHTKSIQCVSDAYLCSACGGCRAICPRNAISFQDSPIGRRYAVVNDACTSCGLCQQVCPSLSSATAKPEKVSDKYVGTIRNVYIGRATDNAIYSNAQSGGVCTALLVHLFESGAIDGAVVVRMDYGHVPQVKGVLVTSPLDLAATQKSCYTPVDLLSVLDSCRSKQSLAVVGLPCHLEAVHNLQCVFPHRFSNIAYRIGLICDRTFCGGIQDVFCRLATPLLGGAKIHWKDKSIGETRLRIRKKKISDVTRMPQWSFVMNAERT